MKVLLLDDVYNLGRAGDVKKVAEGIGLDKRIGPKFLNAGIGYGGSCFPKDVDGLASIANDHKYDFKLLKAVTLVNEDQQKKFLRKIKDILKKVGGSTVAVWGLSFKPNTDDVRKSPALKIIRELQESNYKIKAYDPVASGNAKKELPKKGIKFCRSAFEAVEGADVLALVTDWPEFSEINMREVKNLMRHPHILDGRNELDPKTLKKIGFFYKGIGRE